MYRLSDSGMCDFHQRFAQRGVGMHVAAISAGVCSIICARVNSAVTQSLRVQSYGRLKFRQICFGNQLHPTAIFTNPKALPLPEMECVHFYFYTRSLACASVIPNEAIAAGYKWRAASSHNSRHGFFASHAFSGK
jgi:hypothetical protein